MRRFDLTDEKAEILREILVHHLSELRMEFSNTDDREFRNYLLERMNFLEEFLDVPGRELGSEPGQTAGGEVTPGPKPENLDSLLE